MRYCYKSIKTYKNLKYDEIVDRCCCVFNKGLLNEYRPTTVYTRRVGDQVGLMVGLLFVPSLLEVLVRYR